MGMADAYEGAIPSVNELRRQLGEEPEWPDNPESRKYVILYPEDYDGFMKDVAGNIGILVDVEQAREMKRLAENVIQSIEGDGDE